MQVSIIMGVYNCADTLGAAIESVLAQTFDSWELILCDDGSADGSARIARDYQKENPDRIRLISNEQNMGLNHTLNRCLELARGKYIARQDGDDVSLPDRLEKEVAFLEANPEISFVSTPMIMFDERGDWGQSRCVARPGPRELISGTPFVHAAAVIRADALRAVGGYTVGDRYLRVEDQHLWYKLYSAGYAGANLSEPMYRARDDEKAYRRRKLRYRVNESYIKLLIFRRFGLPMKDLVYVARPIVLGLLPAPLYRFLRKRRVGQA